MILFRDSINVELAAIVDKPVTAGPTSVEARPGAPTRSSARHATTACRFPPRSAR